MATLENAYQTCETLARSHYENFPVASRFLPKKLKRPIATIYSFARLADDIADEGDDPKEIRLKKLRHFWTNLEEIEQKIPQTDPLFIALAEIIQTFNLPVQLFFDLLQAFQQDVVKNTYENVQEVLDYCRHSANPVGRLLLHLTQNATEENFHYSDHICTALQLINFLQDLKSDLTERNRCYLPKDEMKLSNISIEQLQEKQQSKEITTFIYNQIKRAENLLNQGSPLGKNLTGLFGFEIRLIISSGQQIARSLYTRKSIYDRPTLNFRRKIMALCYSLFS